MYHLDRAILERLANENGIKVLIGPAGSVCFIDCILVHGSANNVSPWAAGDHVFDLQRGQ